jgi:IS1 family transposase
LAAMFAERFNHQKITGFVIHELQADEIRTFIGDKDQVVWIMTALEVWSRLWISVIVGRRNYRNVKAGTLDVLQRGIIKYRFLFTTDGFEISEWAVRKLLAGVCVYGQVIKKRRENRVIRVDRKLLLGTQAELEESLFHSEDSKTLNTSFVERHNLTIRQGCSYLGRRTPSHARQSKSLTGQMDLLMLYYNFVRPHMALKFGRLVKTPAMQAGLAAGRISFREVFTSFFLFFLFAKYCRFDFDRPWQALWMKLSIQQQFSEEAPKLPGLSPLLECDRSGVLKSWGDVQLRYLLELSNNIIGSHLNFEEGASR